MKAGGGRVVSWESEELILVDADDRERGSLSKAQAHDGEGVLHRAFSIFLFNEQGELLLQQRSETKRLWPLYWSNSCCSHPRRGESMPVAVGRRLRDELGVGDVSPEFVYKFRYRARYGDAGSEHELCHVFLGRTRAGVVRANPREIAAIRWLPAERVSAELERDGERYTPWFRMEWRRLIEEFGEKVAAFSTPGGAAAS